MEITRYKRGGDVLHTIDYTVKGEIGRYGTDSDAPQIVEDSWEMIESLVSDLFGHPVRLRTVSIARPKVYETDVTLTGKLLHWSGDASLTLPKIRIRVQETVDPETGERRKHTVYPASLEDLCQEVESLTAALQRFVQDGAGQMDLDFDAPAPTFSVVEGNS